MEKYALITGASSGIGFEMAQILAQNGHNVILVARNKKRLTELQEILSMNYRVKALAYPCDLTKEGACVELYRELIENQELNIDFLVNNAGIVIGGKFLGTPWQQSEELLRLNITAVCELSFLFGNHMKHNHDGRILNIASCAGMLAGPELNLYYASKNFVLAFSQALSLELKHTGVAVTALCPGPVATNFANNAGLNNSCMFKRLPIMDAQSVAQAGYQAAMQKKSLKYCGGIAQSVNLGARLFSRKFMARLAYRINKVK